MSGTTLFARTLRIWGVQDRDSLTQRELACALVFHTASWPGSAIWRCCWSPISWCGDVGPVGGIFGLRPCWLGGTSPVAAGLGGKPSGGGCLCGVVKMAFCALWDQGLRSLRWAWCWISGASITTPASHPNWMS